MSEKKYFKTSALSEDSDQPVHSRRLIRIFRANLDSFLHVDSDESDQIARMSNKLCKIYVI